MSVRYLLRSSNGQVVERSVVGGVWVEASQSPEASVGDGLWALPGLVDAHAHFAKETMDRLPGDVAGAERRAREALSAGVLLALDKGWMDLSTIEMIERVPVGERPDIEAAGIMSAVTNGYYPGFAREIGLGQMAEVVTAAAIEGKGWIKLVGDWPRKGKGALPNFTESELRTAVRVAEANGSKVAIHTMAPDVPSMAVAAGVQSIEHGLFLTEDDLAALGARGGIWVPTALNVESLIDFLGVESSGGSLMRQGLANISRLLPLAVEAGVHVLAGTDMAVRSSQVGREAKRLRDLGLPASAAVRSVSSEGFAATGRSIGFELGSSADAVFFAEDPVQNLDVLESPQLVIRHGRQVR